jgi:type III restriction enzyme
MFLAKVGLTRRAAALCSALMRRLVAADNAFERDFAKFLESASDVLRFAKLPSRLGFTIGYADSATNLRYYEPDFVAVDDAGLHYVIETKGREDIDVAHKDRAAVIWCENATLLTDTTWTYVKAPQVEFGKLHRAWGCRPRIRDHRVETC